MRSLLPESDRLKTVIVKGSNGTTYAAVHMANSLMQLKGPGSPPSMVPRRTLVRVGADGKGGLIPIQRVRMSKKKRLSLRRLHKAITLTSATA